MFDIKKTVFAAGLFLFSGFSHGQNSYGQYLGPSRWSGAPSVRPSTPVDKPLPHRPILDIRYSHGMVMGSIDAAHQLFMRDMKGRQLAKFSGSPGKFRYVLPSSIRAQFVAIEVKADKNSYRRVLKVGN